MQIIGFSGLSQSGKDTAASALIEKFGACRVGFGDGVKRVYLEIFGGSLEDIEAGKNKPELPVRKRLQIIGHSLQIELNNCWIDCLKKQIDKKFKEGENLFVVPDVRYISEYDYLSNCGAYFLFIRRDLVKPIPKSSQTVYQILHQSELMAYNYAYGDKLCHPELDRLKFSAVFDNDSTIDELKCKVLSWYSNLSINKT